MELIRGSSLSHILFDRDVRGDYDLSIKDRNYIASQICSGIHYMHSSNIVHDDIKLDNIIVNKNSRDVTLFEICDFGYSKLVNLSRMTVSCRLPAGTSIYMARELVLKYVKNSSSSDIWALGCTLTELYHEKYTWKVTSEMKLRELFRKKKEPDLRLVPEVLREIVENFLSYEPTERVKVVKVNDCYDDVNKNWIKRKIKRIKC